MARKRYGANEASALTVHQRIEKLTFFVASGEDTNQYSIVLGAVRLRGIQKDLVGVLSAGLPQDGTVAPSDVRFFEENNNPSEDRLVVDVSDFTTSDILQLGVATQIRTHGNSTGGDEWHLKRLRVECKLASDPIPRMIYDSDDESFEAPAFSLPFYFKTGGRPTDREWWGPVLPAQSASEAETRAVSQQASDEAIAKRLLDHLNAHAPHYRRLIWARKNSAEYGALFDHLPFGDRTLLDVAQPKVLGVLGDYMVFPFVDPNGSSFAETLRRRTPTDSVDSFVSLPTRGVLAEGKLGDCNLSEEIDPTRFWDWKESPCPDDAPEITGIQPGSRARDIDTTANPMPSPVVNIVNPQPAPDPQGVAAALAVLATPNIFRDMSGLSGLNELLSGLAGGVLSPQQAQQRAAALQAAQRVGGGSSAPTVPSARAIHDYNQAVRSGVAHGDLTPEQGRELIRSGFENWSRPQIAGYEGTGTGQATDYADDQPPERPITLPDIPLECRRLAGFILLHDFAVNGVALQEPHIERLRQLLDILPALESYEITVFQGRASTTGSQIPDLNLNLSRDRASSVSEYLVANGFEGLNPDVIEALGDTDPIRITPDAARQMRRRGYRGTEDEMNRSVLLRFEGIVREYPVPAPVIVRDPPNRYTQWEVQFLVQFGEAAGVGGQIALVRIRPRGVPDVIFTFSYNAVVIGGGVDLPIHINPSWAEFETAEAIRGTDFNYQPMMITEPFTAGVGFQVSLFSYMNLPLLMDDIDQRADLSGLVYGVGFSSTLVATGLLIPPHS